MLPRDPSCSTSPPPPPSSQPSSYPAAHPLPPHPPPDSRRPSQRRHAKAHRVQNTSYIIINRHSQSGRLSPHCRPPPACLRPRRPPMPVRILCSWWWGGGGGGGGGGGSWTPRHSSPASPRAGPPVLLLTYPSPAPPGRHNVRLLNAAGSRPSYGPACMPRAAAQVRTFLERIKFKNSRSTLG